jgi:pSer/pThr/pTyr-binding forkhead associated (FHA) protein
MERLVLSWIDKPLAFELRPGLNRLGRNPTNDFRVPDASVSSFHCEITLDSDSSVHIRDLATTNGTFVDEKPAADGRALVGQTIRLGTVSFKLEWVHIAEANPTPIPEPELAMAGGGEKPASTLLGRLTQTLRLPFGH